LPNILAGEPLVPEFLQDKATPARSPMRCSICSRTSAHSAADREIPGNPLQLRQNTAQKAADAVLGVIDAGGR
jgi:lipid A disaccharide synthetase